MLGCDPTVLVVVDVVAVEGGVELEHADKIRASAAAIQQSEVVKLALTLMTGDVALCISFPTFSNYAIRNRSCLSRQSLQEFC